MAKRKKPRKKKTRKSQFVLNYYLVAFVDLLGQQEELRSLTQLPDENNKVERAQALQTVKQTFGTVMSMRKNLKTFFDRLSGPITIPSAQLNAKARKILKEARNGKICMQSFSDSVVIYVSLSDKENKVSTAGVLAALGAAAQASMVHLAAGHPIRVGIDIGLAAEIGKNEIYGPALSRAYTLESKIAKYPRIVVGDELIEYLKAHSSQGNLDIFSKIEAIQANMCLGFLNKDDDGQTIVDYLGGGIRDLFTGKPGEEEYNKLVEKAFEKIKEQQSKFIKEKNTKVAKKYDLLRAYFDSKMSSAQMRNPGE